MSTRDWFTFWRQTFVIIYRGDLYEYWTDVISRIICPCHEAWSKVYLRNRAPANDNRREIC